ncbi:MAG: RHS repeat-associated core domain-containing protein [Verrucomicrobiae bacterium]|nr:RHS repeat-associated core domain-containing protein [Verrucomicrobiae bacterium]
MFLTTGWIKEMWVGTDDTGATSTDPSGGGAPGNNMLKVAAFEYDGDAAGGDGNVTEKTEWADGSDTRVTAYGYDWRNRRTSTDGEIDFYEEYTYDNLDRLTQTDQKNTNSGGALVARSETKYDAMGRVYQQLKYAVSSGTAGNSLKEKIWYDPAGNVMKRVASGTRQFEKMQYDAVGRLTKSFRCFDTSEADTSYSAAGSVSGNTVQQQVENTYDNGGNLIQVVTRERFHDATGTGELTTPGGSQPKARVSYQAIYPDALGRTQAQASYGTNAASSFTRSATIPARSDTVLVTSTVYDDASRVWKVTDPKATENRTEYDDAGRVIKTIENWVASPSTPDQNRTTETTYTPDNQIETLTAKNSVTGDQVTTWVYGTTLTDSDVARNDLLRAKEFPDKASGSDRVEYKYNRLGQVKEIKDQIGTIRTVQYDKLGRLQHDRVTTLGSGVDGAVRRITRSYEVRGLLEKLTSYDNATVGSGSIVNEVQYEYNGFMQLTKEYQSHSGAVNTGSTPKAQYAYADGSGNYVRRTSLTYPDATAITSDYGSSNAVDDVLNRIKQLQLSSTVLVDYSYLGQGRPVIADYSGQPGVQLTYYTSGGSGEAGDQYTGLDRFGRIVDQRWVQNTTDKERVKYGYDRASNRQWRQNTVAGTGQDEYYTYDGLSQVSTLKRGTLTGTPPSGISGTPSWEENWNFDPTGNWRGSSTGYLTKVAGSTTLNQNRTHNVANEITDITESTGTAWPTPTQDAAGNLTVVPRPLSLGNSFDLKWDAWSRLVEVKNTGGSVIATYRYDGATRRVTSYDGTDTRHYYYSDQWQVLEERLNNSGSADRRFVWGLRSVDDLILRDDTSQRLYALSDAMGSVTAVVNTSGTVQERYGYDGFGQPRYMDGSFGSRGSSSYAWETLFDGYRYDLESGLYQVRYRYLHPNLGRWPSRDPIGYMGGKNLYRFAMNNPVSVFDAFGLLPQASIGCLDPCGDAKKMGLDKRGSPIGGVICCRGQRYACVWDPSLGGLVTSPTAQDIIGKCIEEHEKVHFDEVDCPEGCVPDRPLPRDPNRDMQGECDALRQTIPCLQNSLDDCRGDRECLKQVKSEITRIQNLLPLFCP